jgi:ribosomal protein S18 acetylase RimI-like enzyme
VSAPARAGESSEEQWRVREASIADVDAVAAGVSALLEELGASPPERPLIAATARAVISDPSLGCVLLGESGRAVVGLLAASWQTAIHAGGRYGLIQDLWVAPAFRDGMLGSALIEALLVHAQASDMSRVEVGLPSHRFPQLPRTESFYVRNGFAPVGLRMRRSLT